MFASYHHETNLVTDTVTQRQTRKRKMCLEITKFNGRLHNLYSTPNIIVMVGPRTARCSSCRLCWDNQKERDHGRKQKDI
jgi:hypothetical protein